MERWEKEAGFQGNYFLNEKDCDLSLFFFNLSVVFFETAFDFLFWFVAIGTLTGRTYILKQFLVD